MKPNCLPGFGVSYGSLMTALWGDPFYRRLSYDPGKGGLRSHITQWWALGPSDPTVWAGVTGPTGCLRPPPLPSFLL